MPELQAFRGVRYDLDGRGTDAADVMAPPYDVISPEQREALAARHPHNAVHLDLPIDEGGVGRYQVACRLLRRWLDEGVLVPDPRPSLTVYRMEHEDAAGVTRRTQGVIGALRLHDGVEGEVLPHEETTPKDSTDRLEMLRSCRANLSPIWCLSPVEGLSAALEPAGPPLASWRASDGTRHSVWRIDDPDRIARISGLVAQAPVLIADGHHRYATSVLYRDERRAAGEGPGPWDHTMAFVVELDPDGLTVEPIHRLLHGVPTDLVDRLGSFFEVLPAQASDPAGLRAEMDRYGALAVVTPAGRHLLRPRPERFREVRDLDSSRLDVALEAVPGATVEYQHDAGVALQAVAAGTAGAAVLLRPATIDQIEEIARGGQRMPPKTTFFDPKPSTGAVFRVFELEDRPA